MMLVVILKPFRQLLQDVAGIVERMGIDIIRIELLDGGLGHPVGLGAVKRRRADHEPQGAGERDGILGDIGRAVVAKPLDGLRQPVDVAEPGAHGLEHQVPDQLSVDPAGRAHEAQHLPVAAVQAEGHPEPLPAPAVDLEGIGAPAPVAARYPDRPVMHPPGPSRRALEQQAPDGHETLDPLMVDPRLAKSTELAIQEDRHSSVPAGRPRRDDLPDQGQVPRIVGLAVPAAPGPGPLLPSLVLPGSRNAHRRADRRHGVSSFLSNGSREISFFSRAISRASFRISASIVLRPSIRSSSRIRRFSSLISDEGTSSSSAQTAKSAPSWNSRRHRNSWLGCTSYLRATA